MKEIVGVGFVHGGKSYYFDPQGEEYNLGDMVIVETARGMELGHVMIGNCQVDDSRIVAPLKPVQRRATDEDLERYKQNYAKKGEAMKICQEKIQNRGLDMKLVDAEYTIDGSKVIFYFSSENRVDFRDLVKDLASHFRMRIELRQIGVRDEARMMGGIGICGRPFCCSKWLSDFQPVSIKMAKNQNLSLNPSKISGSCGRLMCCLNFENDTYVDLRKGMPSEGQKLNTRDGQIKVMSVDLIRGTVVTRDIIKDKETGEESLSTETRTFTKEEINEMTGHGHCSCCRGEDKFEMAYQDGTVSGAVDTGDFSGDSWTADPDNINQKEMPADGLLGMTEESQKPVESAPDQDHTGTRKTKPETVILARNWNITRIRRRNTYTEEPTRERAAGKKPAKTKEWPETPAAIPTGNRRTKRTATRTTRISLGKTPAGRTRTARTEERPASLRTKTAVRPSPKTM